MARNRKLPEVLTDEEEVAILAQFNPRYQGPRRNRLMIRVALATGVRIAELTALRFEDCTMVDGAYRVHVHEGKGKKDRMVWLSAALYADLQDMAAKEGREATGRIFCTRDGGEIDHGQLRAMIKRIGRKAGVERLHWHLLRHTHLTRLYAHTLDLRIVQDAAGHDDPKTSALYAQISGAHIRDAMLGVAK